MTFSVFMYAMMAMTCVALGAVLVVDAATAVLRWRAHRGTRPVAPAHRRAVPVASGARDPRLPAATR